MTKVLMLCKWMLPLLIFALLAPTSTKAYSVLTHEALIDASWQKNILPLLKHKYPLATDDDLKKKRMHTPMGAP